MKLSDLSFTGGNAVTLRSAAVERVSVLKKLDKVYDEHAKLVFLFDVSGSMGTAVAHTYTAPGSFTITAALPSYTTSPWWIKYARSTSFSISRAE